MQLHTDHVVLNYLVFVIEGTGIHVQVCKHTIKPEYLYDTIAVYIHGYIALFKVLALGPGLQVGSQGGRRSFVCSWLSLTDPISKEGKH